MSTSAFIKSYRTIAIFDPVVLLLVAFYDPRKHIRERVLYTPPSPHLRGFLAKHQVLVSCQTVEHKDYDIVVDSAQSG
jgi:hypothetical protein